MAGKKPTQLIGAHEQRLADAVMSDPQKSLTKHAHEHGMTTWQAATALRRPDVRDHIKEALEAADLTAHRALVVISDALRASKKEVISRGKEIVEVEVPLHRIRLQAAELTLRLHSFIGGGQAVQEKRGTNPESLLEAIARERQRRGLPVSEIRQ